ncbi:MAG: 16S rRNA (guanine(966)-N(2))-methyltransferase RsmD [Chloroflexota bacterium]
MRIIAGVAKGRTLKVPHSAATRPATDLVRSATFSILESQQADWSRVLDLYAGSGALGLEALSRGAEWADFVEHSPRCCSIIKQNLEELGFSQRAHVYCIGVPKALSLLQDRYGIVFLDAPYADTTVPAVLEQLAGSTLVDENSTVVVLHSARRTLAPCYGRLSRVKERRHGDTGISIYQQEALS